MTPSHPLVDAAPAEALGAWRAALREAGALRETTIERRDLRTAHGHVLARDVYALQPSPPFRCAAMDGYAVHAAATTDAAPDAPCSCSADGTYAPIDTGQYLPDTWDAVLPVEWTAPDPRRYRHRGGRRRRKRACRRRGRAGRPPGAPARTPAYAVRRGARRVVRPRHARRPRGTADRDPPDRRGAPSGRQRSPCRGVDRVEQHHAGRPRRRRRRGRADAAERPGRPGRYRGGRARGRRPLRPPAAAVGLVARSP